MTNFSRNTIFQAVYQSLSGDSDFSDYSVTAAYHDDSLASFPQIVVNPIELSFSDEAFYGDNTFSQAPIVIVIDVFALDTKTLDAIADDVIDNLKALDWTANELRPVNLNDSYAFNEMEIGVKGIKRNLHARTITLTVVGYAEW